MNAHLHVSKETSVSLCHVRGRKSKRKNRDDRRNGSEPGRAGTKKHGPDILILKADGRRTEGENVMGNVNAFKEKPTDADDVLLQKSY